MAAAMLPHNSEAQQYVRAVEKATQEVPKCLHEIAQLDKEGKQSQDRMDAKIHGMFEKVKAGGLDPAELKKVKNEVLTECSAFVQYQQTKVDRSRKLYESVSDQVISIDQSIDTLKEEIEEIKGKIHAAHNSMAASAATSRVGGRGGRKGGRAAVPPIIDVAAPPMAVAPVPVIPPHFVPFTFEYPGKPPFTEYIDPNEPRYCVCKQPSQGDMIACDNPTCKVEWFHNICVGVTKPPDKWICPECRKGDGMPMQKRSRRG